MADRDRSFHRVREQLDQWHRTTLEQLDQVCDDVQRDLDETFDKVNEFICFTKKLLYEQENQLKHATTHEQIDLIEQRIEQILDEIQLLQCLAFHLNCQQTSLIVRPKVKYAEKRMKFRFLFSHDEALLLKNNSLSFIELTISIYDSIVTFSTDDFDEFLLQFESILNLFPKKKEWRLLIFNEQNSFDQGKLFPHSCPDSDEKILLLRGIVRDSIGKLFQDIYRTIPSIDRSKRFYNPTNLSTKQIEEIQMKHLDYGGLIPMKNHLHDQQFDSSPSSNEDEIWDENHEWWHFPLTKENSSEIIERTMSINNHQAGVIIGMNATRIDLIKQKTGAYVYISGDLTDAKRTVIMKGTREQVNRAFACIENLIERHKNVKRRNLTGKR